MKALAAEMVGNFGRRLAPLGIAVRELTGDMQLTKSEVQCTQVSSSVVVVWVMVHVVIAHTPDCMEVVCSSYIHFMRLVLVWVQTIMYSVVFPYPFY